MPKKKSLIIFIKTPKLDHVKTRLAGDIHSRDVLELYKAFLKDLDHRFNKREEYTTWYAIAPEHYDDGVLSRLVRMDNHFIQDGHDQGARMNHAFSYLSNMDFQKMVLIGGDIPEITNEIIYQAFSALDDNNCVLGPTSDGGYYLIGLRHPEPGIFQDITWSSEKVLQQTIIQLQKLAKKTRLLIHLNDVDTLDDLRQVYSNLATQEKDSANFPRFTWQQLGTLKNIL
jgi:uncharacterized protein